MRYPIAIEPGDDAHAWGVVVPDLPGCFSAGDTLDEAIEEAREAIILHLDGLLDDGEAIPQPHPVSEHQGRHEFAGWVWAVVEIAPLDARHPSRAGEHHPSPAGAVPPGSCRKGCR